MGKSRDELVKDVEKMVELRSQNKTFRQIAEIMGYKSAGTVSDLLRRRGYFSVVFNRLEINYIMHALSHQPKDKIGQSVLTKLKKVEGK